MSNKNKVNLLNQKQKQILGYSIVTIATLIFLSLFICNKIEKNKVQQDLEELNPDKIVNTIDKEINSLKELLNIDPFDYKSYHQLGKLYITKKDYPNAITTLRTAYKLAKEHNASNKEKYTILTDLANALSKNDNSQEALEVLEQAKNLKPELPVAYNKTGNIYDRKKKYKKAKKEYKTAQRKDQKDATSYKNLANQLFRDGQNQKAIEELKKGIRNNPSNFKAFENLGDGYGKIKAYDKSIQAYKRALKLNPSVKDKSRMYYKIAKAYKKKNDLDSYKKYLQTAGSYKNASASIHEELGNLALKAGNTSEALKQYKKALETGSQNPSLQSKYNNLYNDYQQALNQKYNLDNKDTETAKKPYITTNGSGTASGNVLGENDLTLDGSGSGSGSGDGGGSDNGSASDNGANKQLSKEDLNNYDQLLKEGKKAFKSKQYTLAENKFSQAQGIHPKSPKIDYFVARSQDKQDKMQRAISNYKKSIDKQPKDSKSHYYLGILYYRQAKYQLALNAFTKAIEFNPDFDRAYYSQGLSYNKLNQFKKSISSYKAALGLNPELYHALYNLGIAYKKNNQFNKALETFTRAYKRNPNDANLFYQQGEVYSKKNNAPLALKKYQEALALNHQHYEARFNLGLLYVKQKQYQLAKTTFDTILSQKQEDPATYYQLGKIEETQNNNERAIELYNKSVESNPKYIKSWLNLGKLHTEAKNFERAEYCYNQAIKNNSKSYLAYNNLGNLHFREKQFEVAIQKYQNSLAIKPNQYKIRLVLGESLENIGNYFAAKNQYEAILRQDYKNKSSLDKLAFLYYRKIQDKKNAKKTFEKILQYYPNHSKKAEYTNIIQLLNE